MCSSHKHNGVLRGFFERSQVQALNAGDKGPLNRFNFTLPLSLELLVADAEHFVTRSHFPLHPLCHSFSSSQFAAVVPHHLRVHIVPILLHATVLKVSCQELQNDLLLDLWGLQREDEEHPCPWFQQFRRWKRDENWGGRWSEGWG